MCAQKQITQSLLTLNQRRSPTLAQTAPAPAPTPARGTVATPPHGDNQLMHSLPQTTTGFLETLRQKRKKRLLRNGYLSLTILKTSQEIDVHMVNILSVSPAMGHFLNIIQAMQQWNLVWILQLICTVTGIQYFKLDKEGYQWCILYLRLNAVIPIFHE